MFSLDFLDAIPRIASPVEQVLLEVAATGFASTTVHGIRVPWSQTVQVGALVLLRPGSIEGRILDPTGAGLPGATVAAYVLLGESESPDLLPPDPCATGRSGESGTFRLEGVAPGVIRLVAAGEGFAPTLVDPFRLREGEKAAAVTVSLFPGTTIEGTTVDEEGRPVPGAEVEFSATDPLPVPSAVSDAEGRFRIGPVRIGRNGQVRARTPTAWSQEMPVEGGARDLVLRLLPLGRISGVVRELPSQRPCSNAAVVVRNMDFPSFEFGRIVRRADVDVHVSTDSEGKFEVRVVSDRKYSVSASLPGFAEGAETVSIRADASQALVGILLSPVPPGRAVRGRVVDSRGEPPRHALVTVQGGGLRPPGRTVRARSDGAFEVPDLFPGDYPIYAWAPGFVSGHESNETVLVPRDGEPQPVLLTLEIPGRIEGRVRVRGEAPPVPLQVSAGWVGTFADSEGRFELFPLDPGEHWVGVAARVPSGTVLLHADDLAPLREVSRGGAKVTVVEGQTTYVEIDASDASFARVHGTVLRRNLPVVGARVRLPPAHFPSRDPASVHPSKGATTGVDGTFEFWTEESGSVEVSVFEADFPLPALTRVERIEKGGDLEVLFELATTHLAGTTVDSSGSPLPGTAVNLSVSPWGPPRTWMSGSVFSGPDGSFRIRGVPPGSYVLTIGKLGRATRVERLELAPLETRDFGKVTLPVAHPVPVRLSWADGRAFDRAVLRVETEDGLPVPPPDSLNREAGFRWNEAFSRWIAFRSTDHLNGRAMIRVDGGGTEIRHLGPGTWRLRLFGPAERETVLHVGDRPPESVEWTVDAGPRR
ncbi:MAG TPA: carboxypeptidase-like regulatory domain-containing protein [Planctomycetota bacterium]|nr:carboxypeptidase-like regulatory domain-containing protein [Planctomycetota bacterium]